MFYRSGYRALDSKFGQNRIRNTVKIGVIMLKLLNTARGVPRMYEGS